MSKVNFTVQQIKEAFPNPIRYGDSGSRGCYCVAGAFLMYLRNEEPVYLQELARFPSEDIVVAECVKLNPSLSAFELRYLAAKIIEQSDNGDFEAAWNSLDILLIKLARE